MSVAIRRAPTGMMAGDGTLIALWSGTPASLPKLIYYDAAPEGAILPFARLEAVRRAHAFIRAQAEKRQRRPSA